jgi:hypothetical protein
MLNVTDITKLCTMHIVILSRRSMDSVYGRGYGKALYVYKTVGRHTPL